MATVKLFLDKRKPTKEEKFPLYLRVNHKTNRKDIKTNFQLSLIEWSDKKSIINSSYPNSKRANAQLKTKVGVATEVISNYERELNKMNVHELAFLISEALHEYKETKTDSKISHKNSRKTTLKNYGKIVVDHTRKTRTVKYANSIQEAIDYLIKFHGNDRLLLTEIDVMFLESLEAFYIVNSQRGNSINGLGVYLRSIRKIINAAIKDKNTELTMEHYPFGNHGYSIKKSTTTKRAIKLDQINKIENHNFNKYSALWHHKNYFMFYFYMRGMNFIDLTFLQMTNIQNGRIVYRRRKTKRGQNVKEFSIGISDKAQRILEYYIKDKNENDFIFPIITEKIEDKNDTELLSIYEGKRHNHNRRLKSIAKALDIDVNLTSYVARHSFATAGLRNGATKAEIGDMLGHTNYYTTETYLSGFEQETLDDVADKIFNSTNKQTF